VFVVFLHPGYADGSFWVGYIDYMHDAANTLGMPLRVFDGERDSPAACPGAAD
jgi:hypothetical protein